MLPSKSWCIKIWVLVSDHFLPLSGRLLVVVLQIREYVGGGAWTYLAIYLSERLYRGR